MSNFLLKQLESAGIEVKGKIYDLFRKNFVTTNNVHRLNKWLERKTCKYLWPEMKSCL